MARRTLSEDVAEKLRTAMSIRGVSQTELARRMGMHQSQMSRWLSGANVQTESIERVAQELGVELEVVIHWH